MKFKLIHLLIFFIFANIDAQVQSVLPEEIKEIYKLYNVKSTDNTDTILKHFTVRLQELTVSGDAALRQGLSMAIAELFVKKKAYDQALRPLNVARNIFNNQHPNAIHYWISEYLGIAYFHRGNYLLAGQYLIEALTTKESKHNQHLENEIRDYIIRICNVLPSFSLSMDFFTQAIDIKQKLGDIKGMKEVAQKFTELLYMQHQYATSLKYAKMTAELSDKLNLKDQKIQAEIDMINALIRMNKKSEAHDLLIRLNNAISISDFHLVSRYETAWGDFELMNGNESEGELHYTKSLPPRAGPTISQYVYAHQAESYRLNGNLKKAYEAQEKYIRELNESYVSNILPTVVQIEERSARSKLSEEIKYLNIQNQLKDTLFRNQKLLADALILSNELQKQELKHQAQLSHVMLKEVEHQHQKLKDEQRLRLLFIASILGMFILGVIIFALYKKQKSKNHIISKQSSDNEMLIKEIHHRVKNNLQIISSLLDMQSISIKDPIAAEAIKESKNRVLSMALIHQNLYHDGHIRSIKIDDYFIHLSKSLFDSYHVDEKNIKMITDISPINLDIDTVVPLGLILNELITNSLKYAFKNHLHGTIHIHLKPTSSDQLHFQEIGRAHV